MSVAATPSSSSGVSPFGSPAWAHKAEVPVFYGVVFNMALFGVVAMQTHVYVHHNDDGIPLRLLVAFLVALDFATTVLTVAVGHKFFITSYLDNEWPFFVTLTTDIMISQGIAFAVQLYMAARLYRLNRSGIYIAIACALLSLGSLVTNIAAEILILTTGDSASASAAKEFRVWYNLIGAEYSLSAAADMIFSVSICYFLWDLGQDIPSTGAAVFLSRLIVFIVKRGVLLTTAQIVFAALWLTDPFGARWILPGLVLGKLYTVTMLGMLNARSSFRERMEDARSVGAPTSVIMPDVPLKPIDVRKESQAESSGRSSSEPSSVTGPLLPRRRIEEKRNPAGY